jgi:ABC-type multidrug transport system fused ATPase/permease subunit
MACEGAFSSLITKFQNDTNKSVDECDVQGDVDEGTKPDNSVAPATTIAMPQTKSDKLYVLVEDEEKHQGGGQLRAAVADFVSNIGRVWFSFTVVCSVICYCLFAANDIWLALFLSDIRKGNVNTTTPEGRSRTEVLILLSCGTVFFGGLLSFLNGVGTVRAAHKLHSDCMTRLMHAPLSWWEATPSGRILSRFSGDLGLIDQMMGWTFDDLCHFTAQLIALFGLTCYIVPPVTPIVFAAIFAYGFQVYAVDKTNREVKRMAITALSPVLSNLTEVISGRCLIASFDAGSFFFDRGQGYVDFYNRFLMFSHSCLNWTQMCANAISFFISIGVTLIVLGDTTSGRYDPALVGLALTYSFLLPYFLSIFAVIISSAFTTFTSLERVYEYKSNSISQEAAWDLPGDDPSWPQAGQVEFDNVSLKYRPDLPCAVKSASFLVKAGEHIGVVGRTAAGKSSLMILLKRIVESCAGKISIDDVDINSVGLSHLRRAVAIVPQDPLVLSGTVRRNLDPFEKAGGDAALSAVLAKVGLTNVSLDTEISAESGLSAGEMQLLSLARVLLRKASTRIILMDEPTSNIDMATDERMQAVIRSEFEEQTIITIAHRANTIIDSKVLVMDNGTVAEFDPPDVLLSSETSMFSRIVDSLGPAAAAKLRSRAKAEYRERGKPGPLRDDEGVLKLDI